MDRFNRTFQKLTENTTCELYAEMSKLVRLYAQTCSNQRQSLLLVTTLPISACMDRESQLADETLDIGNDTWVCLAELQEDTDIKPFFTAVRNFYTSTIHKKFPFADSLLRDLGVLQPEKTSSYDVSTVLKLAKRFPQLDLTDSASLDKLREEFTDFCISPGDLPCIDTYRAADCTAKPCAGLF